MHKVEQIICPPLCLRWEWATLHFGGDAISAQLVDVVDAQNSVHHPPLLKLAQCVKVQMTIAFMPLSGITACTSAEVERTHNLDPEQVEVVCRAMYSSNQPVSIIADLQDVVSRVHIATALVQLHEAYNVGGEPQDEVHPHERDVFAGFPLEQDNAGALNRHL
jgi:hypothetical protein